MKRFKAYKTSLTRSKRWNAVLTDDSSSVIRWTVNKRQSRVLEMDRLGRNWNTLDTKIDFRRKRSAGVTRRRLLNCSGILQTSLTIGHTILWLMGHYERLPKNLCTKTIETDEAAGFNINHFKWTNLNSCSPLSQLRFASKKHSRKESIGWHWETEQRHKNHLFRLITLHNPRVFVRISTSFFFPSLSSGYWKV